MSGGMRPGELAPESSGLWGEALDRLPGVGQFVVVGTTGRSALADDIAQEAILRALSRLGDLEDPSRFGAWLGRIATRRALDVLRAESRLTTLDGGAASSEEWVDRVGADGDLRRAVAALDADRRAVVVMRYWLDLAPPEIAEELEVPLGTVHSRLAHALADLRVDLPGASDA